MLDTFFKMMRSIRVYAPVTVYCIGSMGSGKTTLAFLGYLGLVRGKKLQVVLHYYNGGDCGWECINQAVKDVSGDPKDAISYVIFDDYSFVIATRTREYYSFFNTLFRIRHLTGKNRIIVWFNGHYSKSLSPFVRSTNYRILTSISPAEIKQYSSEYIFRQEDLWEYYNYYVSKPHRHIILAEFQGVSKIVDVTITKKEIRSEVEELIRRTHSIYNIYS